MSVTLMGLSHADAHEALISEAMLRIGQDH